MPAVTKVPMIPSRKEIGRFMSGPSVEKLPIGRHKVSERRSVARFLQLGRKGTGIQAKDKPEH